MTASGLREYRLEGPEGPRREVRFGLCLIGGGPKPPEALRWLAERAGGGDLVILGTRDHDDELTNPESSTRSFADLGCLRSVTTLVVDSRAKAGDPYVAALLERADGLFLPGGDQTSYWECWHGTRVQAVINARLEARNLPMGGSSAGMHSMGRLIHTPGPGESVTSARALADPCLGPAQGQAGITFQEGLFRVPFLEHVLTDTHWSERSRLGRTVTFLARLLQDGTRPLDELFAIACDEGVALLLDERGAARVVSVNPQGGAFVLRPNVMPQACQAGRPLVWHAPGGAVRVLRAMGGDSFEGFPEGFPEGRCTVNVREGRLTILSS